MGHGSRPGDTVFTSWPVPGDLPQAPTTRSGPEVHHRRRLPFSPLQRASSCQPGGLPPRTRHIAGLSPPTPGVPSTEGSFAQPIRGHAPRRMDPRTTCPPVRRRALITGAIRSHTRVTIPRRIKAAARAAALEMDYPSGESNEAVLPASAAQCVGEHRAAPGCGRGKSLGSAVTSRGGRPLPISPGFRRYRA